MREIRNINQWIETSPPVFEIRRREGCTTAYRFEVWRDGGYVIRFQTAEIAERFLLEKYGAVKDGA